MKKNHEMKNTLFNSTWRVYSHTEKESITLPMSLFIGAFGDYRVIGHVFLSLWLSVCPSIFYETASGTKVKFCGLTFLYIERSLLNLKLIIQS